MPVGKVIPPKVFLADLAIFKDRDTAILFEFDPAKSRYEEVCRCKDHGYIIQEALNLLAKRGGGKLYIGSGTYNIYNDIIIPNRWGLAIRIVGSGIMYPDIESVDSCTILRFHNAKLMCEGYDKDHIAYITLENITFDFKDIDDEYCAKFNSYSIHTFREVAFRAYENVNVAKLVSFEKATNNAGVGSYFDHIYVWCKANKNNKVDILLYQWASWYKYICLITMHAGSPAGKYDSGGIPHIGEGKYLAVIVGYGNKLLFPYFVGSGQGKNYVIINSTSSPRNVVIVPTIDGTTFTGLFDSMKKTVFGHVEVLHPVAEISDGQVLVETNCETMIKMFTPLPGLFAEDIGELPTDPTAITKIASGAYIRATITIPAGTYSAGDKLSYYFKSYLLYRPLYPYSKRIITIEYDTDMPIVIRGVDESRIEEYRGRIDVIFITSYSLTADKTIELHILIL